MMHDMRIVLTGFEPFGGDITNASAEVLSLVERDWAGPTLSTHVLPVSFTGAAEALEQLLRIHRPDVLVCLGEAGGRSAITPERWAHVIADARIPDNSGDQPRNARLDDDAERIGTTVPLQPVVEAIRRAGIPAEISEDAGRFVCNATYRAGLRAMPAAVFIHLPAIRPPGHTAGVGVETDGRSASNVQMTLADALRGVTAALRAIVDQHAKERPSSPSIDTTGAKK